MTPVDTIHSLATFAFVLGSAVVSSRLLLLARRSGGIPELLLGGAIAGTAVLGYGVLIAAWIARGEVTTPDDVPATAVVLSGIGRLLHNVGVTLNLVFVLHVFRQGVGWARALTFALATMLWVGFVVGAGQGNLRDLSLIGSPAWLAEYAVVWTYSIWSMVEAWRYGWMLRRRAVIGLASPLVVNRFFLWGWGACFGTIAIWIASIPFLLVDDPPRLAATTAAVRISTAVFGLASVTCSLFAFVSPRWYRRWVEADGRSSAEAA